MDNKYKMFTHKWESFIVPRVAEAITVGQLKPFPSKSKHQPKKLVERKRIIKMMTAIYQRNKQEHKKESDDAVFDEASKRVINQEAQALANQKRTPIQIWFDKNKARLYRGFIFLVAWLVGGLATAIVIMPFSVSAGSNFILLAIFGLIEAMACVAFYREYTIRKKYHELSHDVQHQCHKFHTAIDNNIQQRKKNQQNEQRSL